MTGYKGAVKSQQQNRNDPVCERTNVNTGSIATDRPSQKLRTAIEEDLDYAIEDLLASLPVPEQLSASQRRGIIARYTAVLEGNFIYWMTGAYLAVTSGQARSIILDNLHEEVRDSHPEDASKVRPRCPRDPNGFGRKFDPSGFD